jgi:hypothetical protein
MMAAGYHPHSIDVIVAQPFTRRSEGRKHAGWLAVSEPSS